jgi:hypothetical protein
VGTGVMGESIIVCKSWEREELKVEFALGWGGAFKAKKTNRISPKHVLKWNYAWSLKECNVFAPVLSPLLKSIISTMRCHLISVRSINK